MAIRLASAACAAVLACAAGGALAQTPPAQPPAGSAAPAPSAAATPPAAVAPGGAAGPGGAAAPGATATARPANPVLAKVGDDEIRMSDVQASMSTVPEQYRQLPPQVLVPMLVNQLIDRQAILIEAQKRGLQNDPQVKAAMQRAADMALENELVATSVRSTLNDAAVKAAYDAKYGAKSGEEEVHAAHILVPSEAKAKDLIAQLDKGADFAALAKANSTDPGAAQGGDLGWFKKGDMLPEFSAAAFALQPGQITQAPVHTRYGWHVIKLEGRRTAPPPALEEAAPQLRQELAQAAVQKVIKDARDQVKVTRFTMDGAPMPAGAGDSPAPAQ
jgi:peptidyl-prolyl cis-trans isomerase C